MGEKIRISELQINDTQKMVLTLLSTPKTVYQLAAKLKKSYSSVNQTLGILNAMGYVIKIKKLSGGCIYHIKSTLEP